MEESNSVSNNCFHYNARCALFFSQVFISITTLFFSFYMLLATQESPEIWLSLITMILGVWLPNPKMPPPRIDQ